MLYCLHPKPVAVLLFYTGKQTAFLGWRKMGWMDKEMMSDWLREVCVKRPDIFFHKSPSLLIYVSMRVI